MTRFSLDHLVPNGSSACKWLVQVEAKLNIKASSTDIILLPIQPHRSDFIDGEKVGEIKDIKTAGQYSAITGYGLLIGRNTGTPVSHSYEPPFTFTGTIEKVTVEVDGAPKVR